MDATTSGGADAPLGTGSAGRQAGRRSAASGRSAAGKRSAPRRRATGRRVAGGGASAVHLAKHSGTSRRAHGPWWVLAAAFSVGILVLTTLFFQRADDAPDDLTAIEPTQPPSSPSAEPSPKRSPVSKPTPPPARPSTNSPSAAKPRPAKKPSNRGSGQRSRSASAPPARSGRTTVAMGTASPSTIFGPGNVYRQDISGAPLHPNSGAMIDELVNTQISPKYNGVAAFNAYQYSGSYWVADADTPLTTVEFDDCQGKGHTPAGLFDGPKMFVDVPIPPQATPAVGTDQHLSVWSPSRDALWEFWVTTKTGSGWKACWGGRIDNVSKNRGQYPGDFGAAASGLSIAGSMITQEEARSGRIDHAMGLNLVAPAKWDRISYPATRSDGFSDSSNAIPEGARLRLDPSVNVDQLGLTPIGTAVAKAAQRYGFIVTDKAGSVSVVAEGSPQAEGEWKQLLGGVPAHEQLAGFPWDKVQVIQHDWGKP
ncbi:MAG: hypothetical protein CSA58_08945 [Micrococcales bacterium]|nr:MAG: hypothetical protein CSA58_08945 [Micrococcales bacterium]